MFKSINVWSFPGGLEGTISAEEAIRLADECGFQGLELGIGDSGPVHLGLTEAECKGILATAGNAGIQLPTVASGLYWGRALGDSDSAKRAQAKEDVKAMLRIGAWLGAKTLLTIPGAVDVFFLPDRPRQAYADVHKYATEGLHELIPFAQDCGVRIGIENVWNKFLITPGEMLGFLNQFNSPWVGSYLDVANALPFAYPEDWIRLLGDKIFAVHFKDFRKAVGTAEGFVDLLEGDVNWPQVMAALRAVGYDGPVTAEMIPLYKHAPIVRSKNAAVAMDAILAMQTG